MLLLQEGKKGKKGKKLDMRPPGIEPGPNDSESDVLTTPPSMHMALTRNQALTPAYLSATPTITKKKTQRRNLNSAPSARVIKDL